MKRHALIGWFAGLCLAALFACGSGSVEEIDAAPTCGSENCADGCCDGTSCVTTPSVFSCGAGGGACADCTDLDERADACTDDECICSAAGYRCSAGWICTATGCIVCTRDCSGKCAGANDNCDGICPEDDCDSGCCNEDLYCVPPASQTDSICGADAEECRDCTLAGNSCNDSLNICTSNQANDAEFVTSLAPSKLELERTPQPPISINMIAAMTPGESFGVEVTMRNIGTSTWTAAGGHKLGAANPRDSATWGPARVELEAGDSIAPGDSKTFQFTVTAPAQAGVYSFQWRMLKESVEWFGEFTEYLPVVVSSGGGATVCEAARSLADTDSDAAPTIQGCINAAAAGAIVELPAGVYRIDSKLMVSSAALTLRTEGKSMTDAPCAVTGHDCAELAASTSFGDTSGILQVTQAGSVVDHLVINGNKTARAGTSSGTQCAGGSNSYGYNMRLACSSCTATNSVSKNALCGTGLEVSGAGSGAIVWRNSIVDNGVHDQSGMWADGVTAHDYADSTFAANYFADNTDIDLIFGGCAGCVIQGNTIEHTDAFAGGAFAALMLHAWPAGATSGNFTAADTSGNYIDCGPSRRCGFGLYIGPDAWYDADTYGGSVHHNVVTRAQQGVLIDDAHDLEIYNNHVSYPGNSTTASCGLRATSAYGIGTTSANIDTTRDTMGASYINANWDGCIPNWWQQ